VTSSGAPAADRALIRVDIATAAQLACLLEVSAPKPGNVSPGRHFGDARYEDFLASAAAIGVPLAGAATRGIGATVRLAVDATARWTRSNTNLGMVLLLVPLARAAAAVAGRPTSGIASDEDRPDGVIGAAAGLRQALRRELEATTVDDARDVYAAIRRASPGGLGRAATQDVANDPTIPLLDAMRLAADRDGIAREYSSGFELTFGTGVPALEAARRAELSWDDAIVETFLTLLAASPDTHIARRGGAALAAETSERARTALAAGGVRTPAGKQSIEAMDRALRGERNTANPGTTADLTAAAIFVVLVAGGWLREDGGTHAAAR
jgi:triphosphoribosyl-dephospho-CoA synthase